MRPAKLLLALATLALLLLLIFCPCHDQTVAPGIAGAGAVAPLLTNEVKTAAVPVAPAPAPTPPAPVAPKVEPAAVVPPVAVTPPPVVAPPPPVAPAPPVAVAPPPVLKAETPPVKPPPVVTPPQVVTPPPVVTAKPPAPVEPPRQPVAVATSLVSPASLPLQAGASACTTTGIPGLVDLISTSPEAVGVGEIYTNTITLRAQQCAGRVLVYGVNFAGAEVISTDPNVERAAGSGDWQWPVNDLEVGESRTLRLVLRATREGKVGGCAAIRAVPRICGGIAVGRPALTLEKSGPTQARLGQPVTYTLTTRNTGSSVARQVVLTDMLPAGLGGPTEKRFELGDLRPGEVKTTSITVNGATAGRHCNGAVVRAANVNDVRAEACTAIVVPGVKITKTGPKEQFLGREAVYQITVANTGDTDLTSVLVTDTAPPATRVLKTSAGGSPNSSGATWSIGTLKAGEQRTAEITLTSTTPGSHCNDVRVNTAEGVQGQAQACTLWKGVSAVLFEVVDDPDPIQVGEQTMYTLRVTNQGRADLTNIRVVVDCPETIKPLSAANGTVSGQRVTFNPVPTLAPRQAVTFQLPARGVREGDARLRATLLEDQLLTPVVEEESTRVY